MTAGDYLVSDADLALLRSPSQRYKLRVVLLPAYTPVVYNRARGVGENMRDASAWTPDGGIGPNKVGVVGDTISYVVSNAAQRDGGAVPDANKSMDWGDGSPVESPVSGTITHTYSSAGTYTVVFSATDSVSGVTGENRRYVKIYDAWASAYDGIAEIASMSGSYSSGGWQASLRVTKANRVATSGDWPDRACVLLYVEQEWDVDDYRGTSTVKTIGRASGYSYDPEILLQAYVVGDTVRVDAETNSVTFDVRTAEYFLQQMMIYEMRWLNNTESGYGHVATGLTFADAANHLLFQHTNWATWHNVYTWRASWPSANTYKVITLNEGSVWSALQGFAANEFGRLQCSRYSGLMVVPNVNVRGLTWWGTVGDPPEMPFDEHNCTSIEVAETQPSVQSVELEASNPFKGTTLHAAYPASPGDIGERVIVQGLTCEVQANLTAWAERMYWWRNARYAVRVTTAMPRVQDIGQMVVVDYADPQGRVDLTGDVGGGAMRMPFYVEDISYSLDPGQGLWQATFTLAEIVRTRWNLTTQTWQSFDGIAWEDA